MKMSPTLATSDNKTLTFNLECFVPDSFNFSWLSLDEVDFLGTGEVIRPEGDEGRGPGDDVRFTEDRGDEASNPLGDVGNGFEDDGV